MRSGLLLINLGTPNSADTAAVRSYLRQFLIEKRVIDLPAVLRFLLVYGLILPFRSRKSALAYQKIWTKEGSPLLVESLHLVQELQAELGDNYKVALGMRYGNPSIADALKTLAQCNSITVLPLYPQYSSAATGSSIEQLMRALLPKAVIPSLRIISDFYQHPAYINAQAQLIQQHLMADDYLIFSYHGIPERQILASGCDSVCNGVCPMVKEQNPFCYKAQCHQTSTLLAQELKKDKLQYSTAFQSRLGKTPWIKPYTDELLVELAGKGIKNIAVACPSFVTDCLETLEEIGIRAQQQWKNLGGERFTLVPSMNADLSWVKALVQIVE